MSKRLFTINFYPALVEEIFSKVALGESITLIGMPGIGKSNPLYWFQLLIHERKENILALPLDLNNVSADGELEFYKYLLLELVEHINSFFEEKALYNTSIEKAKLVLNTSDEILVFSTIKSIMRDLLLQTDVQLVLIIDSLEQSATFNPSFFNRLFVLRNLDKERVAFVFSSSQDVSHTFSIETVGSLFHIINYNKRWLKPLNVKTSEKFLDELAAYLEVSLRKSQKESIVKLSSGHAGYIKALVRSAVHLKDNTFEVSTVSNLEQVSIKSQQIWQDLKEGDKENLQQICSKGRYPVDESEYLQKTGLVVKGVDTYGIFSPLLTEYIKNMGGISVESRSEKNTLLLDQRNLAVKRDNSSKSAVFTKTEFELVRFFFKNRARVVSREEVAAALWGDTSRERYSDWAIDKIVSRIREKIEDNPRKPQYLITLRGVGYRFSDTVS